MTTLGFTAAIAVVVAVCAAATLLPAMLGALGPHINSLRFHIGKTHPDDKEPHGWRSWAERIVRMPWRSAIVAMFILIVLALPIFKLQLGQNDISALPKETTSRQAYDGLNAGFGPGVNGPLLIASEFTSPEEAQKVLPALQKAIGATSDVAAVTEPSLSQRQRRGGLHGGLEIGALGRRHRHLGRKPPRRSDPGGARRDEGRTPTSAARRPATSISPTRSRRSCR